jgi:CheY-like chemotaxis protein
LSIDDFGTGYSSLEYLHRMPLDEVKIDRSFVAGLGVDAERSAIVASIVSLAHAMNKAVVAEGVETADQLERLRATGCDFAQGYYLARPMPAAQIFEYLAADATGSRLPRAAHGPPGIDHPNETVLVVEDADEVRMLATMSLSAAGFTVHEAGNGSAALALARRLRPTCVLLDVGMPEIGGIEVCASLRADPATASCTIVMLTSHANPTDKAEAFLAGADDYIVKPFIPRDLVTRVRAAIHRGPTTRTTTGEHVETTLLHMLQAAREHDLGNDPPRGPTS